MPALESWSDSGHSHVPLRLRASQPRPTGEPLPQQIVPQDLAKRIQAGEKFLLLDVRQPWEHEATKIPGSVLLPLQELPARHQELKLEPGQQIVTYCHHGVRSFNAAAFLEQLGNTTVYSLAGGIAAWSRDVDPKVPTY